MGKQPSLEVGVTHYHIPPNHRRAGIGVHLTNVKQSLETETDDNSRRRRRREWYAANREKVLTANKKWRDKDPQREKQRHAAYRQANPDQIREKRQAFRQANRQRIREQHRASYQRNAPKTLQKQREDYAADPEPFRARNRKYLYGLTPDQLQALRQSQANRCAVCKAPFNDKIRDLKCHIDHDHSTSQVRGLLCKLCNLAIGYARDNPAILSAMARYLRRDRAKS